MANIPVITLDGPAGSGKGTVSHAISQNLGWHLLDSGALYRLTALAACKNNINLDDIPALATLAKNLDVTFSPKEDGSIAITLCQNEVTSDIRTEACGLDASQIASIKEVRDGLLQRQRDFRQAPGLVADGRDMGTVVFPDAPLKVYLEASAETRAKRRYKQLKEQGVNAMLARLIEDIQKRDLQDSQRKVSPMKPAEDAIIINTDDLDVNSVVSKVMKLAEQQIAF